MVVWYSCRFSFCENDAVKLTVEFESHAFASQSARSQIANSSVDYAIRNICVPTQSLASFICFTGLIARFAVGDSL